MESDFSILKMDKGTFRSSLPSVSVEGQFQARQSTDIDHLEQLEAKENFVSED